MSCSAFKAAVTKENIPSVQRGITVNSDFVCDIQHGLGQTFMTVLIEFECGLNKRAYVLVGVSHHMVVGHTHEVVGLA